MNILVFGATGPNGKEIVRQALDQGHHVCAFARNPDAIQQKHANLSVARGDILDAASVDAAMAGRDAVLSALGVKVFKKNTIMSDGTKNILAAMQRQGVRRFICETSLGLGDSKGQPSAMFNYAILPVLLRNIFADKEVQEKLIMDSDLDWTIVRPAGLTNGPRTGVYQVWVGEAPPKRTNKISRADVADFMLKQLSDSTYLRKTPGMAY